LKSDITSVNAWDFFQPEHETPIIHRWFPESLELKKIFRSIAGSVNFFYPVSCCDIR